MNDLIAFVCCFLSKLSMCKCAQHFSGGAFWSEIFHKALLLHVYRLLSSFCRFVFRWYAILKCTKNKHKLLHDEFHIGENYLNGKYQKVSALQLYLNFAIHTLTFFNACFVRNSIFSSYFYCDGFGHSEIYERFFKTEDTWKKLN